MGSNHQEKERIKNFAYFWEKFSNNGIKFLHETHSLENTINKYLDHFRGERIFHTEL